MANAISIEALTSKLKDIFCRENRAERKYSEVWLSEADFGGLYQSGRWIVNVKAEHDIMSCNDEIKYIITNLFKQLSKEELSLIWRVYVYNAYEEIHCLTEDILVYTHEIMCAEA